MESTKVTSYTKAYGPITYSSVIYQKMKKCYVYVSFPSFSHYSMALCNRFFKEQGILGVAGVGCVFVCDEKMIADILKLLFKYIATKQLTKDVGFSVEAEKLIFSQVQVRIVGKCNSFSKTHLDKPSKKLAALTEFVKKLETKQKTQIVVAKPTVSGPITIDFQKRLCNVMAIGAWFEPFVVDKTEIVFYDKPSTTNVDSFKTIIKTINKLSNEAKTELIRMMTSVHGCNTNTLDMEDTNEAYKYYKGLILKV